MFKRTGNLDLPGIKRVLARENSAKDYANVRDRFQDQEPTLWKNLQHWIKVESSEFKKRNPDVNQQGVLLIELLLERYFIRGFNMHTELINKDLQQSLGEGR